MSSTAEHEKLSNSQRHLLCSVIGHYTDKFPDGNDVDPSNAVASKLLESRCITLAESYVHIPFVGTFYMRYRITDIGLMALRSMHEEDAKMYDNEIEILEHTLESVDRTRTSWYDRDTTLPIMQSMADNIFGNNVYEIVNWDIGDTRHTSCISVLAKRNLDGIITMINMIKNDQLVIPEPYSRWCYWTRSVWKNLPNHNLTARSAIFY